MSIPQEHRRGRKGCSETNFLYSTLKEDSLALGTESSLYDEEQVHVFIGILIHRVILRRQRD
jgi:hypothetical protein